MKTSALLVTGVDRIERVDTEVPAPSEGEVLIEVAYSSVSPGTEMRCMAGRQPGVGFPFIPGYSQVGRIVARGAGVTLPEGAWVFSTGSTKAAHPRTWGGHIAHAIKPAADVVTLPAGVDPLDASIAKLAAISHRGVRLANTRPHDQVAVVGLGPIGQFAARLHHLTGARVVAADLSADRVALAKAAGVEAIVPSAGLKAAFEAVMPGGADVVVDSTGALPVLQQSVALGKDKPWDDLLHEPTRLVIQGSYPENVVFDYHLAFFRELSVHFPRDNQPRDLRAVLRYLAEGKLKVRDLISRVASPSEAPEVYAALRAQTPGLVTAVFKWA
jgi:2-desacetyl-2-hydroxyethyl bacteriochlorophyllide A dehydrogenase